MVKREGEWKTWTYEEVTDLTPSPVCSSHPSLPNTWTEPVPYTLYLSPVPVKYMYPVLYTFPQYLFCRCTCTLYSVPYTSAQYLDEVRTVAKAFIQLGLRAGHGVGIIGFNSPEWFFAGRSV